LLLELMRKPRSLARDLALIAALFMASRAALAAPAKRHKPKHVAPAAADSGPAAHDDDSAAKDAKAAKDAPAAHDDQPEQKLDASADVKLDEAKPAKPDDKQPKSDAPPASDALLKSAPDAPGTADDAALGQREAARLAAGRVEVAVSASVDVGSRHFSYSDPIGRLLAPYQLTIAPLASLGLEAYPLASSNVPGLRDLGFRGHISRAFGVNSKTPDGNTIETSWTRFGGELRERVLVPGPHAFELGIDVGADASYFVMSTTSKVGALVPSARTIALRFGFDTRLLVAGRFSLLLGGAYLAVTSPGEIYERFRDPHVGGIDGDFGCALGLTPGLEARLTARYTRYFASFKPRVGDPAVAGGALDEQSQLGLGVRYAH
jgi:hypothetical protein